MKILLFGQSGQIGWELNRCLLPLGQVLAPGRELADFSRPESLRTILRDVQPDVIVNAAAYTSVDKAESEEALASAINAMAPRVLAEEAKNCNALLIHYSTDYVFDGSKSGAYNETDIPNPLNAYGRSKLAGERAIQESGCDYIILRTSWVYSSRGKNFMLTILRLAGEREELKIIDDQSGTPTWARNIADVTAHVLAKSKHDRAERNFESGIFHYSASGETTWYGFASAVIESVGRRALAEKLIARTVIPITTHEYPLPATRPANSQMDSALLAQYFGLAVTDWRISMNLCLDEVFQPR